MSKRNAARANTEAFGSINERTVEADFSGLKLKEESEATFIALGSAKAAANKAKAQRSDGKAVVTDLGFKPKETERPDRPERPERTEGGRDGRGGRGRGEGRGRGRGGRGEGRGGGRGAKIDLSDASAFPSL